MSTKAEAPTLPSEISPDGHEVWDWAARMSEHVQRMDRVRRLTADIAKIGRTCGDCDKWMKSRECPREVNVGGRSRGPSCASPRCGQFIEDRFSTKRRAELAAELASIEAQS